MQEDSILVPLTRGKFAIIDAVDAADVLRFRWHAARRKQRWYAMRTKSKTEDPRGGAELLHQRIIGRQSDKEIDHINGDGLDCRRANLRHVTHSENMANQGLNARNRSGYKGVSWVRQREQWIAGIKYCGKFRYLGSFATAEEAARAYDAAARERYGSIARLNFSEEEGRE